MKAYIMWENVVCFGTLNYQTSYQYKNCRGSCLTILSAHIKTGLLENKHLSSLESGQSYNVTTKNVTYALNTDDE